MPTAEHLSRRFPRPVTALLATVLLLTTTGCVSTQLTSISALGADYEPLSDEIDLWAAAREAEQLMLDEVEVVQDPALDDYLFELVDRLESPGMAANREVSLRVTVLDDPAPYAFAYPHGSIYIHSGLLSRVENEDQLAAVLAHEIAHVEGRHMARHERALWNRKFPIEAVALGISLLLLVDESEDCEEDDVYDDYEDPVFLEEPSDDFLDLGIELASKVTAQGYGRRLEREADEEMLRKVRAAGSDLAEVFELLDSVSGFDEQGHLLAQGLGAGASDRLRDLAATIGTEASEATASPILTPEDLGRLLRGLRLARP